MAQRTKSHGKLFAPRYRTRTELRRVKVHEARCSVCKCWFAHDPRAKPLTCGESCRTLRHRLVQRGV